MTITAHQPLISEIKKHAIVLTGRPTDYTPLLDMIGDAQYVVIGTATHGTEEFFRLRTRLTKKLIRYYGFSAVAVEANWPDCYRINRFVRGGGGIYNANSALGEFLRFPSWLWRNEIMVEFLDWLVEYNEKKGSFQEKAGFYGLDLYSLHASMEAVIRYLDKVDPEAADRARYHYSCFDHCASRDPKQYGLSTVLGLTPGCEREVVEELVELQRRRYDYIREGGVAAAEEYFWAEQNAKLAVNAESYYRGLLQDHVSAWNLRESHMLETLFSLKEHLSHLQGEPAKVVVWAHNAHAGDARATELASNGKHSLGQKIREIHGSEAVLIGLLTDVGTVTAASEWDGETRQKKLASLLTESQEALFQECGLGDFILLLRDNPDLLRYLNLSRLQRNIGVLYHPETEGTKHYLFTKLSQQFDAIVFLSQTRAIKPLETYGAWHLGEIHQTYPDAV